MADYPVISGVDDAGSVRVALIVNKEIVSAPLDVVIAALTGLYQPLDTDLTSWAAVVRAAGFDTFTATPSSANLAALVTDESGSDKLLFGTPWVTYTPTFTGFGTVSNVSIWSRRIGDSLHIRGRFASGTSTAVQARMTMGFNGTNGGLTVDSTKVTNLHLAGLAVVNAAGAASYNTLIEPSVAYITFGIQTAGSAGLAQALGNAIIVSGTLMSIQAEIPITGW